VLLASRGHRHDVVMIGGGNLLLRGIITRPTKDGDLLGERLPVGVVSVLSATQDAPAAVAAIERRMSADSLRPTIIAGEMPRPDVTVLGEAFALEYERWAGLLARSIARDR
jgi:hypothetical protein